MAIIRVLVAVLCLLAGCYAFSEDPLPPVYRLPSTITPTKYTLTLEPDLDNNVVTGSVVIKMQTTSNQSTTESMNSITLHLGADSEVDETAVTLLDSSNTAAVNLSIRYYDSDSMIKVVLPQDYELEFDSVYTLTLYFTSPLYTEPKGLFYGAYNSSSKYVASNFRATYARNVFPCFDEPQFQVPLVLRVLRPASYNGVFTTALKNSVASGDKYLDTFKPVAAGVSLSSLGLFMSEVTSVKAMGLNVYAPSGYNTSVTFLTNLVSDITSTLGSFPTSPKKLALVVLPDLLYTSFSSLGLVFTTPEVYNDEVEAELQNQALRQQLAEAFLQQYLAFSKTPSWWSDLWLSDSLAAFLALQMLPEMSLSGLQITEIRSNGFNLDYGSFSGPVVNNQLLARLDIESAISNQTIKNKGLSILTMWQNTLPEGLVNKTIVDFTAQSETLTTTDDFLTLLVKNIKANTTYDCTGAVGEIPIWLYSDGNPVVTVTTSDTTNATLTQSADGTNTSTLWSTSISLATGDSADWTNVRQAQWLIDQTMTVTADLSQWLVINLENAPYMVNYGSNYQQILAALMADNSSSIPADVRASIQADAVALALTGSLDFDTALSVLNNTQHEQVDWVPVVSALDTLSALIGTGEWGLEELGMYVETMFSSSLLTALDLRNSAQNSDQWLARALLTPLLCRFDIGPCRSAISTLGQEVLLLSTSTDVDANDMDNVACLGARYQATSVDNILANYATADNPISRRMFTLALGCVIDSSSVQKVLDAVSSNTSTFSIREKRDIMVGLASSVENSAAMVSFIASQPEDVQSLIGSAYFADVIKTLGKFKVDLTALETLSSDSVDVDSYVKLSVTDSVAKANSSYTWWSVYGPSFLSALPQASYTAAPTTAAPVTTAAATTTSAAAGNTTGGTSAPVSAGKSLAEFQFIPLVLSAVFTVLSTKVVHLLV